ncbi:MAG TPA: hypothetical protein VGF15_01560 [Solirubrobacteraceae bacterium]
MRGQAFLAGALSLLAGLLAGCGGSSTTSTPVVPSSPAASQGSTSSADAVAYVSKTPIAKAGYEHWLAVERSLGGASSPSHQALCFLITSEWVVGEAGARHITVSEAVVRQRFARVAHQSFPKAGELESYLAKSGETESDLLARIRVELLAQRIAAQVTAGKSSSQRSSLLSSFERTFHAHWKKLTNCKAGYVMEDCKQYKGKPENLTATSSGSQSGSAQSGARARASGGEVYTAPGAFSISSSAFERNGAIPAKYTCAGAGISPPLSWGRVPGKAAELMLFVIDDSTSEKSGGIRWVVGGIDPHSTGVQAGRTPAGGVVGTNTAGNPTYSPICPAHGKSDTIEFVLYALKQTIALSPGFQPTKAESEYGSRKLQIGQAAVTYAVASR